MKIITRTNAEPMSDLHGRGPYFVSMSTTTTDCYHSAKGNQNGTYRCQSTRFKWYSNCWRSDRTYSISQIGW